MKYTRQEKVLDVGPIHATAEERKHVSIPLVLGGLVLAGGVALVVFAARKKSQPEKWLCYVLMAARERFQSRDSFGMYQRA